MSSKWLMVLVPLILALALGCGGGEEAPESTGSNDPPAEAVPGDEAETGEVVQSEEQDPGDTPTYESVHDPDAVYTYDDIPGLGNYVKVNFEGLTDAQVNRVVHRLRTENCSCEECGSAAPGGLTLDECLVTRIKCGISMSMAATIVAAEKLKD